MENKLVIAAAGSGKTTFLVREALKNKDSRVLLTTFTQANEAEIRKKITELNGCIPENITIQTWFSFLLQHGVKPYQGGLYEDDIMGLLLVSGKSALYQGEANDFQKHYFSKGRKIYSDKISKFILRCNEQADGEVIARLSRIFHFVFIDEIQDLAGYDLELLKLLFDSKINTLMVGDPRQSTYSTNDSAKNQKFKKSSIIEFFNNYSGQLQIDDASLKINHRCNQEICDISNELFPEYGAVSSGQCETTGHDGFFLLDKGYHERYVSRFKPMQLRYSRSSNVIDDFQVMNFGDSKGLSFDRVIIYPTKKILDWMIDKKNEIAPTTRSKFYVALTRARFSVAIVCDSKKFSHTNFSVYKEG